MSWLFMSFQSNPCFSFQGKQNSKRGTIQIMCPKACLQQLGLQSGWMHSYKMDLAMDLYYGFTIFFAMEIWWFLVFVLISKAKLSNTFAFSFYKCVGGAHFEWISDPQVCHPFLLLLGIKSVNRKYHMLKSTSLIEKHTYCAFVHQDDLTKEGYMWKRYHMFHQKSYLLWNIPWNCNGDGVGGFWTNVVRILYLNVGVNFQKIYVLGQGILASKLFQTWYV